MLDVDHEGGGELEDCCPGLMACADASRTASEVALELAGGLWEWHRRGASESEVPFGGGALGDGLAPYVVLVEIEVGVVGGEDLQKLCVGYRG